MFFHDFEVKFLKISGNFLIFPEKSPHPKIIIRKFPDNYPEKNTGSHHTDPTDLRLSLEWLANLNSDERYRVVTQIEHLLEIKEYFTIPAMIHSIIGTRHFVVEPRQRGCNRREEPPDDLTSCVNLYGFYRELNST